VPDPLSANGSTFAGVLASKPNWRKTRVTRGSAAMSCAARMLGIPIMYGSEGREEAALPALNRPGPTGFEDKVSVGEHLRNTWIEGPEIRDWRGTQS
jgi:hypothetical protein